jgi:lipid II:glycine glycyltransferase (peptidoglycan interpeptide bridge formation enzyme)
MAEVSLAEWRTFLHAHPEAHLLQSAEWGQLKAEFGWEVVRLIEANAGAQVLFRRLPLGLSIAYVPKPLEPAKLMSMSNPAESSNSLQRELDRICRGRNVIFCKIEPDGWQSNPSDSSMRTDARSAVAVQPRRTIVVDLSDSESRILARMKQKTRYNIRLAERKGVGVRGWDDIRAFHDMLQQTGRRDGFAVHSIDYYTRAYELFRAADQCALLVAELENRPLAALMVFAAGSRAWYLYGASTDDERQRMPTYLLQWEAMRWARRRGCLSYDLWGVPDEEEQALESGFEARADGLWGVYRFKRGFGGQLMRSAEAHDIVYRPAYYALYSALRAGRFAA